MDHYQGVNPGRFFANIGFEKTFKCLSCTEITEISSVVDIHEGSYLTYQQETEGMTSNEKKRYRQDHVQPKIHALSFQCQDCGDINLISEFEDLDYLEFTDCKSMSLS